MIQTTRLYQLTTHNHKHNYKPSDFFQKADSLSKNEDDISESFNDNDKALAQRDAQIKHLENKNHDLEESNKSLIVKCTELSEALKKKSFEPANALEQQQTFENMTVTEFRSHLGELVMDKPTNTKFNFMVVEQKK